VNKIILTINPTRKFRIEPEIGFRSGKEKKPDLKNSTVSFGLGVFGLAQRNKLIVYGGLRFEYGVISQEEESYYAGYSTIVTNKFKRTMIGPAMGGEYFFAENFSIAGEVSIMIVSLKESIEPNYYNEPEDKSNYTSTCSGLFFRFYF
jgi:hypothetical protein